MGAALKLDPTRIKVTEFWKVKGDPLARALRNRFKKDKVFPKHKFLCIYSDELLVNKGCPPADDEMPSRWLTSLPSSVSCWQVLSSKMRATTQRLHNS